MDFDPDFVAAATEMVGLYIKARPRHGIDGDTRDAADRTHGTNLNKHVEDGDARLDGQLFHARRP